MVSKTLDMDTSLLDRPIYNQQDDIVVLLVSIGIFIKYVLFSLQVSEPQVGSTRILPALEFVGRQVGAVIYS